MSKPPPKTPKEKRQSEGLKAWWARRRAEGSATNSSQRIPAVTITPTTVLSPKTPRVYTTRQVVSGSAVRYVEHDAAGDWHFYDRLDFNLPARVQRTLAALLKLQPSLANVLHLPAVSSALAAADGSWV